MEREGVQVPDCQDCGACCVYLPLWVEVTAEEASSLKGLLVKGDVTPYAMAVTTNNRCVGLVGLVGQSCRCSVYERRPSPCREFERGGARCLYFLGYHRVVPPWTPDPDWARD